MTSCSHPEIEKHSVSIRFESYRTDSCDDSSEIRRGHRGQPYAVNTPLWWTGYIPMGEANGDGVRIDFIEVIMKIH